MEPAQPISHLPPNQIPTERIPEIKPDSLSKSCSIQIQPQPTASASSSSNESESQIPIERIPEIKPESPSVQMQLQSQSIKDDLFKSAMNGNWETVISFYREHKWVVQTAKITRAKETALHVAIFNSKKEVVKELIRIIDSDKIEMMTNERDENPLHLAASLGQVDICRLLVEKDMELIGKRNKKGETPLYLAARHGKKGAFYALHPKCPLDDSLDIKHDVTHCKRNDGNTILHVAILGEYFDLAFQIINWYPELIKFRNEKGQTALHHLARNPSAFRSGCHLGPLDDFIYRCVIIDPIKLEEVPSDYVDEIRSDISIPVPKNYQTCSDLFKMFINAMVYRARGSEKETIKDVAKQLLPVCNRCKHQKKDLEAPNPETVKKQVEQGMPGKCKRSHIKGKHQKDLEAPNPEKVKKQGEPGMPDEPCQPSHIKVDATKEASHVSTSRRLYPSNYDTFFRFLEIALQLFLFILGFGFFEIRKIKEKKWKHTLAREVMTKLVRHSKVWENVDGGSKPTTIEREDKEIQKELDVTPNQVKETEPSDQPSQDKESKGKNETIEKSKGQNETTEKKLETLKSQGEKNGSPFLIAAKMGVKEMVKEILYAFSVAIWDEDEDEKNVVLLVVENRHPKIYKFLLKNYSHTEMESVYKKIDKDGNSALHWAATMGKNQPWRIPGAALQMQWELKWYKFIKSSMPRHFFTHRNKEHKTPREVFAETHLDKIKDGGKWLTKTSQSCSLVAMLIATVAYAAATTVPGGPKESTGIPNLRGHPSFNIFTIASLVALCLSVTSLIMFLSILTSRYQVTDFLTNLPTKLILGLTSLFISIAAMLVSFCAGHFFDLEDRLHPTALPIYVITCLPITIYAVAQLPLYLDLIKSTIISIPRRSYEFTSI